LQEETWVACVDESSTQKYNKVGVIFEGHDGEECEAAIQLKVTTTNNEAKYEAIIVGMNMAWETGVKNLEIRSDS
jgi:ribonuclease HI